MKPIIVFACLSLCVVFSLAGCSKPQELPAEAPKEAHDHASPHGGALVELAGGTIHVEFLHDEHLGTLVVHVLDGKLKPMKASEAPLLNMKSTDGPLQLVGVAASAAAGSEWSFRHDALKGHVDGASLRLSVDGKSYSPELPHAH